MVVVDSAQNRFGDYWSRAYSAKIDDDGKFTVTVDEPFDGGTLYVGFCFDNGTNSGGNEKSFQGGSENTFIYTKKTDRIDIE